MVTCSCGKVIDKAPDWLTGVQVEFVCNNCPNRKTKNIAFIQLDAGLPATDKLQAPEDLGEEEAEDADLD